MIATTNAKNHSNEIISISGLIHNDVHLDKGAPDKKFKNSFCCKAVIEDIFFFFFYWILVRIAEMVLLSYNCNWCEPSALITLVLPSGLYTLIACFHFYLKQTSKLLNQKSLMTYYYTVIDFLFLIVVVTKPSDQLLPYDLQTTLKKQVKVPLMTHNL